MNHRTTIICLTLALLLLEGCSAFRAVDNALWTPAAPAPAAAAAPGGPAPPGEPGVPLWAELSAVVLTSLGLGWGGVTIRALGRELAILRNGTNPPAKP